MKRKLKQKRQVAALPIEIGLNGQVYVMLVTSRETKRWIIPKGWPSRNMTDPKAAAREAREEAGVTGKIDRKPVGSYSYRKVLPDGSLFVHVDIYALWVKKEMKRWSEQTERTRIWATLREAAKMVREPGLQALFIHLSGEIEGDTGRFPAERRAQLKK